MAGREHALTFTVSKTATGHRPAALPGHLRAPDRLLRTRPRLSHLHPQGTVNRGPTSSFDTSQLIVEVIDRASRTDRRDTAAALLAPELAGWSPGGLRPSAPTAPARSKTSPPAASTNKKLPGNPPGFSSRISKPAAVIFFNAWPECYRPGQRVYPTISARSNTDQSCINVNRHVTLRSGRPRSTAPTYHQINTTGHTDSALLFCSITRHRDHLHNPSPPPLLLSRQTAAAIPAAAIWPAESLRRQAPRPHAQPHPAHVDLPAQRPSSLVT